MENILDEHPDLIFENIFGLKILEFFDAEPSPPWIRDPGWKKSNSGSGIGDKHPGSATLLFIIIKVSPRPGVVNSDVLILTVSDFFAIALVQF
jgi:hypothetical protein